MGVGETTQYHQYLQFQQDPRILASGNTCTHLHILQHIHNYKNNDDLKLSVINAVDKGK